MTATPPHSQWTASRLARLLSAGPEALSVSGTDDFAGRLGNFVAFGDALKLSNAQRVPTLATPEPLAPAVKALSAEVDRVRAKLTHSIVSSSSRQVQGVRIPFPSPPASPDDYEAYHRFYLSHQRDMDLSLRHLRAGMRDTLTTTTPRVRRLVALDAALDDILLDRSRLIFAGVAKLLRRLFQSHWADVSDRAATPGALDECHRQWALETQGVLLAELDIRFQPVMGILDAVKKEVSRD